METLDAIRSRRNVRSYADAAIAPKDLGQATMSIMVAAADLGIGSAHSAAATRTWRGACWASRGSFLRLADHPGHW